MTKNEERWSAGPMHRDELQALPEAVELPEVCRARGIGRAKAYAVLKANRRDEGGRVFSELFGIPMEMIGKRWVATKEDLLASMRARSVA